MNETALREVPVRACVFGVGDFEAARKKDSDRSGSVRLVARTGQPIEHWFWGRVVHDLSGMRLHKRRLSIDYCHDPKEVVGYLNHFATDTGDLVASGALVPFKDSDRATEILHKMGEGVPYEASINFGGDGIVIEEVDEGAAVQVNGYAFDGPGIVIREWPLRNVAICPLGADMYTESASFAGASGDEKIRATVLAAPKATKGDEAMSEIPAEVAAPAAVVPEAVVEQAAEVEVVPAVEALSAEASPAEPVVPEPVEEPEPVDARKEFTRMRDDFGAEIAGEVFAAGGEYGDALTLALKRAKKEAADLREENAALRERLAAIPAGGAPVAFANASESEVDADGVHRLFRDGTRKPKK